MRYAEAYQGMIVLSQHNRYHTYEIVSLHLDEDDVEAVTVVPTEPVYRDFLYEVRGDMLAGLHPLPPEQHGRFAKVIRLGSVPGATLEYLSPEQGEFPAYASEPLCRSDPRLLWESALSESDAQVFRDMLTTGLTELDLDHATYLIRED